MISKIKSAGIRYSSQILFNRVVPEWLFRCRRFHIYQRVPGKKIPPKNPGVQVTWANSAAERAAAGELARCEADGGKENRRAAVAKIDGAIVGTLWYATESFEEPDLGLVTQLATNQVWLFSAYVKHEFRRQGVYVELFRFVVNQLAASESPRQILFSINPANHRSLATHRSLGIQLVGKAFVWRFLAFGIGHAKSTQGRGSLVSRSATWNHHSHPVRINLNGLADLKSQNPND